MEKPLDQFAKNSSKPDGLSPQCKECKHKYYEEYYKKNKGEIYKRHKAYKKFLIDHNKFLPPKKQLFWTWCIDKASCETVVV